MTASARLALLLLLLVGLPAPLGAAQASGRPVIAVATQNQYFGADLTPLLLAPPDQVNAAFLKVLEDIAASDFPARARRQARAIARQRPDLVALQEVLTLGCVNSTPEPPPQGGCDNPLIAGALLDFLEVTLAAFEAIGSPYRAVAAVRNLDTRGVVVQLDGGGEIELPGLPLVVDGYQVFITAVDHDVILAPRRLARRVRPVAFPEVACQPSLDGCNYAVAVPVQLVVPGGVIDLSFARGFVAVDTRLRGQSYRFVDTHLEVEEPEPGNPASSFFQAAQAAQLIALLEATTPPRRQLLVAGDINSSPEDEPIGGPLPLPPPFDQGIVPPYQQFVEAGFDDVWTLRPRLDPGFTCCQAADLLNEVSLLDERIDMVFTRTEPHRASARVFGKRPADKTRSGLWPSDHAGVGARLLFRPQPALLAAGR
jgi:endonuclease/exonuclease/phosphatase family metal-dependent hydrolase